MKDKIFKTIITGIIMFFVFSSASWGDDNFHKRGRNHYHRNSSDYMQKNHGYSNNHGKSSLDECNKQRNMNRYNKKHKRWHKRDNYNKQKNTCYSRRSGNVHSHNHYRFFPYNHIISSGAFCSPGMSFSFSTNGRW